MVMEKQPLNLTEIRAKLAGKQGRQYWRSLEEVADTEAFRDFLQHEFPSEADTWSDKFSRRGFLRVMGASLALAGLTACTPPAQRDEKIIPYTEQPELLVPGGKPLFFATAFPFGGYANGVLVESHEGRPTKIEGNPDHPDGNGTTNTFAQASILSFYDPDRAQIISKNGKINTWGVFVSELNDALAAQNDGVGLRLLTRTVTSPSLIAQINAVLEKYPAAKWHQYDPINRDNVFAGAKLAFGEPVAPRYHFQKAKVVLSLDADFFAPGAGNLRYSRDFMAGRHGVALGKPAMNRLYVVESTPTMAGGSADHRLSLKAGQIEAYARAIAAAVGVDVPKGDTTGIPDLWISAVADDLKDSAGESVVIAGDHQPPVVHALAHAINDALGNVGATVEYLEPVEANPGGQLDSLRELVSDMAAGSVNVLMIFDGNPIFDAPADLDFEAAMSKVPMRVVHSLYRNETAYQAEWHIPARHYLESWGDARAFDGTTSIIQPLIAPLFVGSKSVYEMLDALLGKSGRTDHDIVKAYWQDGRDDAEFVVPWRTMLHDGLLPDTAAAVKSVTVDTGALANVATAATDSQSLEVNFRADPSVWDGEWANNGWMQELPRPFTKLTWDNAALVSPATAETLGVSNGDMLALELNGRKIEAPAWITPGHAKNSITVHLGYGRTRAGSVGNGTGFNAYPLRTTDVLWFADGVSVTPTGGKYELVSVQDHWSMEGRNLARSGSLEEFVANPTFAQEMESLEGEHAISLYPPVEYDGYKWGMSINLGACIGCNACTVACQAENNIPVVGKKQVSKGREMHWIRIDRYYEGDIDNPEVHHQPLGCQQCENAPCESVCPVEATVHSHEGLNDMVYNRCVGTRYCANNCPYKVRRFNFLDYNDFEQSPLLSMLENPDVTVRSRGIMEKCTYCTQRISAARIDAKKEGRSIKDGEVVTACQAVCPTQAIYFGDMNDPDSAIAQMKESPLDYTLLDELNTRARTTYLAKVKNLNPRLEGLA